MIISFDKDNLKKRLKTQFLVDGNTEYWSVYDFSYKYRTRIFNNRNEEVAYTEKDIFYENKVNLFDYKGNRLDEIVKTDEGYRSQKYLYIGDIDKGEIKDLFANEDGTLSVLNDYSVLYAIMFVTGLVEIERKD